MIKRLKRVLGHLPYLSSLRSRVAEQGAFPAGHYYSPCPSRRDVLAALGERRPRVDISDVDLRRDEQRALLDAFSTLYPELPFAEERDPKRRYHFDQAWFCHTDAIILYSFLRHFDPGRIIEVGSGFSSAVILDTLELFQNSNRELTFIDPFPERLRANMRSGDEARAVVLEQRVQDVAPEIFGSLESGDLLFIDSSHVLKFGSDLHMILFEVLPMLPAGVHVQFHDVFYPFEYPDAWLEEGRYWNECYFLRAFLSGNTAWEITFFNHYANLEFADVIETDMPLCRRSFGGSLYIKKLSA